jgi:predicted  nucleic acid-binding Zn-ribbon protein
LGEIQNILKQLDELKIKIAVKEAKYQEAVKEAKEYGIDIDNIEFQENKYKKLINKKEEELYEIEEKIEKIIKDTKSKINELDNI